MISQVAENKNHISTTVFTELCSFENFNMEIEYAQ